MDFLARFKGRTNFVTKEGINSVLAEGSTPIEKVQAQIQMKSPRHQALKLKVQDSPKQVLGKRESNLLLSPKAATMQFSKMAGIERPNQNSNLLKSLQNSPKHFEVERPQKLNRFYTPQNRFASPQQETPLSESFTFSNKVASLKTYQGSPSNHSYSYSQAYNRTPESPQFKQMLNYSMANKPQGSFMQEERRGYENQMTEPEEARLARMSFIERQEQVLNRYRPRLHSDYGGHGGHGNGWSNQIKYNSPKH